MTTTPGPLTDIQRDVLRFVVAFWGRNQSVPTLWEICEFFGWKSRNGALAHVRALAAKGFLTLRSKTARGYTVVGLDPRPAADAYLAALDAAEPR